MTLRVKENRHPEVLDAWNSIKMEEKLTEVVFFLELVYSTGSIKDLFRTCEERVTFVTDIDAHLRFVRSYFELVPASTTYFTLHIVWVNTFSHCNFLKSLFL
jgi:hypothetical protein